MRGHWSFDAKALMLLTTGCGLLLINGCRNRASDSASNSTKASTGPRSSANEETSMVNDSDGPRSTPAEPRQKIYPPPVPGFPPDQPIVNPSPDFSLQFIPVARTHGNSRLVDPTLPGYYEIKYKRDNRIEISVFTENGARAIDAYLARYQGSRSYDTQVVYRIELIKMNPFEKDNHKAVELWKRLTLDRIAGVIARERMTAEPENNQKSFTVVYRPSFLGEMG